MAIDSKTDARAHVIAAVADFPEGAKRAVEVEGRSICVVNHRGRYVALRNMCPHYGAPLCAGPIRGTMRPSEPQVYEWGDNPDEIVIQCPWHGYEFRLVDGRSTAMPDRMRVSTYRVKVEDDQVVVYL